MIMRINQLIFKKIINLLGKFMLILMLILCCSSSLAAADFEFNNLIISEIVIKGLTRSDVELIKKQLPYKKGDRWTTERKKLTKKRLSKMNTFDPLTLKVSKHKVAENKVKVVIKAQDPNPFMIHPVEFLVFKGIDLFSSQLTQYMLNPLGNGINFNGGVSWGTDSWKRIGVDYLGAQGRKYSVTYKSFINEDQFNNLRYEEAGCNVKFGFRQILKHNLTVKQMVNYRKDTLQRENKSATEQEYLLLTTGLIYDSYGQFDLEVKYGSGLLAANPGFKALTCNWDKITKLGADKFVVSLKGGITSPDTPLNYRFKGAGYSSIPLRGNQFDLEANNYTVGTKYVVSNIEYHRLIVDDWAWLIGFVDTGKIISNDSSFGETAWNLDGGAGAAVATPLGPIRGDIGFDLVDEGYNFNLRLGHSF